MLVEGVCVQSCVRVGAIQIVLENVRKIYLKHTKHTIHTTRHACMNACTLNTNTILHTFKACCTSVSTYFQCAFHICICKRLPYHNLGCGLLTNSSNDAPPIDPTYFEGALHISVDVCGRLRKIEQVMIRMDTFMVYTSCHTHAVT